jgi:hypothetical protein
MCAGGGGGCLWSSPAIRLELCAARPEAREWNFGKSFTLIIHATAQHNTVSSSGTHGQQVLPARGAAVMCRVWKVS